MSPLFTAIVVILALLAVMGIVVGVANDAVNFLNSALGSKVAPRRVILWVAAAGILVGTLTSSGMMEVARSGVFYPGQFSFQEIMMLFLGMMLGNVLLLDLYNTLGLPTSTTVSMVFGLLGAAVAAALFRIAGDPGTSLQDLSQFINTGKAMVIIAAILLSVALAFVAGTLFMYISRLIFSFRYAAVFRRWGAVWCGISLAGILYFALFKGLKSSGLIPTSVSAYVGDHVLVTLLAFWAAASLLLYIFQRMRLNIMRITILSGTFALALAFAGNDLVNFIGVPLAGLSSYQDYMANANGATPDQFMMTSLMDSAKTTPVYLLAAGAVMIIAMATSKKAQNVIKTSVDLSRQDEGDEMFGSSSAARVIVRNCQATDSWLKQFMPKSLMNWINSRFDKNDVELEESAAFDVVRAAVNLVLASMLITIGTNLKLPLSTTYVTFMVAMGSSLADRAWSRESAVFRVTGVLSVIGGWFITAGVAFAACAIVCLIMHFGGVGIQSCFMALVIFLLIRSNIQYNKKAKEESKGSTFQLMMRSHDPEIVWDLLRRQVSRTQSFVCHFALNEFNQIMDGLANENPKYLRHANKDLKKEQDMLKKFRRQEMLGLKKSPMEIAIERNTWFHLGANSNQQFIYSLRRMLDPIKEHVDNNFNPLPAEYTKEFAPVRQKINDLMRMSCEQIETSRYENYHEILAEADACKDELSVLRKKHIDRIQHLSDNSLMQISLVYLNVLQESQEFLSVMRHQLRAAKKFMEK